MSANCKVPLWVDAIGAVVVVAVAVVVAVVVLVVVITVEVGGQVPQSDCSAHKAAQ